METSGSGSMLQNGIEAMRITAGLATHQLLHTRLLRAASFTQSEFDTNFIPGDTSVDVGSCGVVQVLAANVPWDNRAKVVPVQLPGCHGITQ
jgi:hypothetical protein